MKRLIFLILFVGKIAFPSHFTNFDNIIYDQTELAPEANDQAKIALLRAKKILFYADELKAIANTKDSAVRYIIGGKIFSTLNNYPIYLLSFPLSVLGFGNIAQMLPCGVSLCAYSFTKISELKERELDEMEERENEITTILAHGYLGEIEEEYVVKKMVFDHSWQNKIEELLLRSYYKALNAKESKLLEDMIRFPCAQKKLILDLQEFRASLRAIKAQLAQQTRFNRPVCEGILIKLAKSTSETETSPPRLWIAAGGKEQVVREAMEHIALLLSRQFYVYACKACDDEANQNIYESALLHPKVGERLLNPIIVVLNAEKLTKENRLKMLRSKSVHSDYFGLEIPVREIALICIATTKEKMENFECFEWKEG